MDQVDREASTKEEEGIVNQECVTLESTDGMEYFCQVSQSLQCASKLSSQLYSCREVLG